MSYTKFDGELDAPSGAAAGFVPFAGALDGEPPKKRTWGQAAADTGVQLAEGVNTIAGAVPSLVAPDSGVAGFFRDNAESWRAKQSDVLQGRANAASAAIDKAGEDGVISQVVEAAKQYSSDPALAARFVTTNLPSMIPGIGAAKLAQAAALARGASAVGAASIATTAAGGVNSVLNAGGARGEAFEDIKKTLESQGRSPEESTQIALDKSRLPAVVGGVTGFISGKTGLESALTGKLSGKVAAAASELAGEQLEEVAPKLATNYQASEYDNRAMSKDVGRTIVETAIGSGPGAIYSGMVSKPEPKTPQQAVADIATAPDVDAAIASASEAVNAGPKFDQIDFLVSLNEIKSKIKENSILQKLRDAGDAGTITTGDFLNALSVANNPVVRMDQRELARDQVSQIIEQLSSGTGFTMPGAQAEPAPVTSTALATQQGGELSAPIQGMQFDPNTIDGQSRFVDELPGQRAIGGPRALTGPIEAGPIENAPAQLTGTETRRQDPRLIPMSKRAQSYLDTLPSIGQELTTVVNQNVQNATPGTPAKAQAAPVEAPKDAGVAAVAQAVPAAPGSAGVEAAGVKTLSKMLTLKSTTLMRDDGNGRRLYDVAVSPEFRNKHFVNGRMPVVDGLELKPKSDVTGNVYDRGWVLIDNREQLANRRGNDVKQEIGGETGEGSVSNGTLDNPRPVTLPVNKPEGPVFYGTGHRLLTEGGKPFKTKRAADDAKRLQPMMRVKKVKGGYVLTDKTHAQVAAQAKAAARLSAGSTGAAGMPQHAHGFLAREGGLSKATMSDLGFDKNHRIGSMWLFKANDGMTLERATEKLIEGGYLKEGASHSDAINLVKKSITTPQYTADGWDRIAQAEADARFEDHLAAQEESAQNEDFDPFESLSAEGFTTQDDELAGYSEASDPIKLEVNALIEQADSLGIDIDELRESSYEATKNGSEQDYLEHFSSAIAQAISRGNQDSGDNDGEQGNQAGQAEDFLTSPTREDILAKQQAEEDAANAKEAADKAKDEADRAARIKKEIDARQAASAENFTLGQSAEDALAGQGDIFGGISEVEATSEQDRITQLRNKLRDIEDKIVGAANMAPGFIEDALKSRKVPKALKDQRDDIKNQIKESQASLDQAKKEAEVSNQPKPEPAAQATAILDAAEVKGKERIDVLKDVKSGTITPEEVQAAYPAKETAKIEDIGEKIGGARKDTAISTGPKGKSQKQNDDRPTWAKRFNIGQIAGGFDISVNGRDVTGKWVISDTKRLDRFGKPSKVGEYFDSKEAAEKALPLLAVAQKHRVVPGNRVDGIQTYEIWRNVNDRKRVKVVDIEFTSRTDAMQYMADHATEIIETNTTFGEADLPKPDNVQRIGAVRRTGDVKGEDFMQVFGLRGVEFGNWNNQEERQEVMNEAYDGLLDMAEILNVPAKAIGLNGDLALAFGARGKGLSGARAHYETDRVVMNLTKMNGAGALAHEWFHALDHYLARQDGKSPSKWKMNADGTRSLEVVGGDGDMASSGFRIHNSGVREELRQAYTKLVRSLFNKAEQYVEDTARADKFVAVSRGELEEALSKLRQDLSEQKDAKYYKRNNKPASAEQLAEFDRIAAELVEGRGIETEWRVLPGKTRTSVVSRFTNEALEKLSEINKAVRGRSGFDTTDRNGTMDRLSGYMRRYNERLKMLADANNASTKTKNVPTSFAMDAKSLDQGRGGDYWTTPHEMAARAFQGYVEDKIAEKEGRSPFLNYAPENLAILTPWGAKRPYPSGAERKAMNAEFENFIGVIQTKEDEFGNVAMYSRGENNPENITKVLGEIRRMRESYRDSPGLFNDLVRLASKDYPGTDIDSLSDEQFAEYLVSHKQSHPMLTSLAKELVDAGWPKHNAKDTAAVAQVQNWVNQLSAKWKNGPEIQVVSSIDDLPVPAASDTRGLYYRGTVYLVASRIGSKKAAGEVLAHESIAHYGLREMLGESDWYKFMRQMQTAIKSGNKPLNAIRDQIRSVYVDENGKPNLTEIQEADEIAAKAVEMAIDHKTGEFNPGFGFLKSVFAKVAQFLRDMGFEVQFTNLELQGALVNAMRNLEIGNRTHGGAVSPAVAARENAQAARNDQTQTPEFKRWFGDSVVTDNGKPMSDGGKPLVVYHGTDANITEFKVSDRGTYGGGIYLTPDIKGANDYAIYRGDKSPTVYPLYVSIKNPATGAEAARVASWKGEENARAELIARGYDGVIDMRSGEIVAFDPTQIKSAIGNNGNFDPTNPDIRYARGEPTAPDSFGAAMASRAPIQSNTWNSPSTSKFDNIVYTLQNKQIDTKRVVESIKQAGKDVAESVDVYLREELFHGRSAKRTEDFLNNELTPLLNDMKARGISLEQIDKYLHARHAEEANKVIASRNPDMPDGGSGMKTQDAKDYLNSLGAAERNRLDAVAKKIDGMIATTRQLYADEGLESQETVDSWGAMFKHYVPLMREDKDGGMGIGQGFSIKGKESKGRVGSSRAVVDILANIAMQREKVIVRGEKNRVATALVGLATENPNPDFWTVGETPHEKVYDPKTNSVVDRIDPMYKSRENVVVAKVKQPDGNINEVAVVFNEDNDRAVRMAASLKNLDALQLNGLLGLSAKISRYISSINTQYNPIFGIVNLARDVQGAMVNLSTTALKGQQKEVSKHVLSALKGVYLDARAVREGKTASSKWAALNEEFQNLGGQTGYRDLFATSEDRAKALQNELMPYAWMDGTLGKIFTANGSLKVPMSVAQDKAKGLFDWLSDYNLAMENAVRLSAFKVGLDQGMTKERAASLAKNLTVNFNRKGQISQQAGALYAFFNAGVQGTARLSQVLFEMDGSDPRTIRLSGTGKKVVAGGIMLGVAQAVMLAAAGFGDDDPPEFVRERNLIIPTGWTGATGDKAYITIPMPLGLHVLPNIGRVSTEFALGGFRDPVKRAAKLFGLFTDAFNPMGGGSSLLQILSPTPIDPLVALAENKDGMGRTIAKTSRNPAVPGFTLAKDTASKPAKMIAEAINFLSGGTEYKAGVLSPTPDQVDFLIGQATGGVGREISKGLQTASAAYTGEELPTHKIPLVGRFYGDSDLQSAQSNAFYSAVKRIEEHELEIKGLRKDGKSAELAEYMSENPEARLVPMANRVEIQIQNLQKRKRELMKNDADAAQIKAVENQITERMKVFNMVVRNLREKQPA